MNMMLMADLQCRLIATAFTNQQQNNSTRTPLFPQPSVPFSINSLLLQSPHKPEIVSPARPQNAIMGGDDAMVSVL
jgi:hypothetical protein